MKALMSILLKALILIFGGVLLYNCTPMIRPGSADLSSMSYEELEAKARDNGENNPRRSRRYSGGSGSSSGGSGGGGQPILKTFCPDCKGLVDCLNDATIATQNLKKGWYYFCPEESDFCLEMIGWASYQLTETKYREWMKHKKQRMEIPDKADAIVQNQPSPAPTGSTRVTGPLNTCIATATQARPTRDITCDTTHAGNQQNIDACKERSNKQFFVDFYGCWGDEYDHQREFFCDD